MEKRSLPHILALALGFAVWKSGGGFWLGAIVAFLTEGIFAGIIYSLSRPKADSPTGEDSQPHEFETNNSQSTEKLEEIDTVKSQENNHREPKKDKPRKFQRGSTFSECPVCKKRYSQCYSGVCETCGFDFSKSQAEYV